MSGGGAQTTAQVDKTDDDRPDTGQNRQLTVDRTVNLLVHGYSYVCLFSNNTNL